MTEEMIKIIEDRYALELGLRIIMRASEVCGLPDEAFLPTFNDSLVAETFKSTLENVVGKKYDEE